MAARIVLQKMDPGMKAFLDGEIMKPKNWRKICRGVEERAFDGEGTNNVLKRHLDSVQSIPQSEAYRKRKTRKGIPLVNMQGEQGDLVDALLHRKSKNRKMVVSSRKTRKGFLIRFHNTKRTSKGVPVEQILQKGRLLGFRNETGKTIYRKRALWLAKHVLNRQEGARAFTKRMGKVERISSARYRVMVYEESDTEQVTAALNDSKEAVEKELGIQ